MQSTIEQIKYDIGSKRKAAALDGARKTSSYLQGKVADKMIASCQDDNICTSIIKDMSNDIVPLQQAIKASQDAFQGSEQEREALDKAYDLQQSLSRQLSALEEQMVPKDYLTPVPSEYADLPQLKRRATVEMVLKKSDAGDVFNVNGANYPQAKMVMVIDGYTGTSTRERRGGGEPNIFFWRLNYPRLFLYLFCLHGFFFAACSNVVL